AQLVLIALFSFSTVQAAGEIDPTFNGGAFLQPRGEALVVARQTDGKILVGGSFQVVNGIYKPSFVRLDADGSVDAFFNPTLGGTIRAVGFQSDGKIIVGGESLGANGLNVVRLNVDGTRDTSFTPPTNVNFNRVDDLIVRADDKIVVGGNFQYSASGGSRTNLTRLNANGTNDDTFAPPSNLNVPLLDIEALPDGRIVGAAGGSADGVFLKRFNQDGSDDATFANAFVSPGGQTVFTLKAQPNGKILIGGSFNFVNNQSKVKLARLNADGTLDETFNATSDGAVYDIEIGADGKILVAGSFQTFNGLPRRLVVRLENDGTVDAGFNFTDINPLNRVNDVLPLPDGKIVVIGTLGALRLNADGTVDSAFRTLIGVAGSVTEIIQQPDGKILIAGGFGAVGNLERKSLARFNADGTPDATFNPILVNQVVAPTVNGIALQSDGKVLVVGGFEGRFIRLNPDGSLDTTFNAAVPSNSVFYDVIVQPDGKIIASGYFANPEVRRFNQDGSLDSTFQTVAANNFVLKLFAQPDGKILIGGDFTAINSTLRGRVARLNADGSLDAIFNPFGGANNRVYDVAAQSDGKVVIAGAFNTVNGATRSYIARLNVNGTLDTEFVPPTSDGGLEAFRIQPNGKIIIGGGFTLLDGVTQRRIARLNTNGTRDTSFNTGEGFSNMVRSLTLQSDGKILVGGNFLTFNNVGAVSVARLLNDAAARTPYDFDGDGKADLSVFRPSNSVWYQLNSINNQQAGQQFGASGDVIAPADFDGDGKTDLAVYRGGVWYIQRSALGFTGVQFGLATDLPVPADYDGDGKADIAVWRPSNGTWYRLNSSNGQVVTVQFGQAGDKPTLGDFDGNGTADIAVFRPTNGVWYRINAQGQQVGQQFGQDGDLVVPADYDGDGKTDLAVYRPAIGTWYILRSALGFTGVQFGNSTDKPAAADYDGDGRADITVFRPSNGVWYQLRSTQGFVGTQFGITEDLPIPNAFVR
ncbi:MAG: FG-GAP-like repeat-containing protein, partial [Pyrinomonadaceae bacterium]|nr:FG-GAP-like repeat-containing protein [Pyrinomonadaceae bacterium]